MKKHFQSGSYKQSQIDQLTNAEFSLAIGCAPKLLDYLVLLVDLLEDRVKDPDISRERKLAYFNQLRTLDNLTDEFLDVEDRLITLLRSSELFGSGRLSVSAFHRAQ